MFSPDSARPAYSLDLYDRRWQGIPLGPREYVLCADEKTTSSLWRRAREVRSDAFFRLALKTAFGYNQIAMTREQASGARLRLGGADHPHDPTPLYFKLETILRAAIESREYPPGSSLPAERQLGDLYGVSRITVRRALDRLSREGLIRRGRGRNGGTFVLDGAERQRRPQVLGSLDRVVSKRQISRIEVLAFDVRPCHPDIAATLCLPSQERIRYVERLLFTPDGPIAHVRNFLPLSVGGELRRSELKTMLLKHALARRHGVKLFSVQDEVEACLAESRIASMLTVRPGSALLLLRRVFLATGDEPVNLTLLLIRDKYRISVTLRDKAFG